jgi:hypothetical protein
MYNIINNVVAGQYKITKTDNIPVKLLILADIGRTNVAITRLGLILTKNRPN